MRNNQCSLDVRAEPTALQELYLAKAYSLLVRHQQILSYALGEEAVELNIDALQRLHDETSRFLGNHVSTRADATSPPVSKPPTLTQIS